jgi:hypothetical protein
MCKHLNNEDILMQEHEEFLKQVSESGVPLWLLQYYGYQTQKLIYEDNQKTDQSDADKHTSDTPL